MDDTQAADAGTRRIVTCDDCGTPFAAMEVGDELRVVNQAGPACSSCGGSSYSVLAL